MKLFLARFTVESFEYHTEGSHEKEKLLRLVWASDEKAAEALIKRRFEVDIPNRRCATVDIYEISEALTEEA